MFGLLRRRNRERSLLSEGTLIDHTLVIVGSLWIRGLSKCKMMHQLNSGNVQWRGGAEASLDGVIRNLAKSYESFTYRNTRWCWRCMRVGILEGEFRMDASFARGSTFITLAMSWQKSVRKFENEDIQWVNWRNQMQTLAEHSKDRRYRWSGRSHSSLDEIIRRNAG
jgi:hypothetical protein